MDVFGTIKNGIDIAHDIWRFLEGIKEAPETLKQLRDEVRSMEILLCECQRVFDKTSLNSEFYPLLRAAEQALRKLQEYVARYQKKVTASGALPMRIALQVHQNDAKFQALSRDIQHHKLTLNLICTMQNTRSQETLKQILEQVEVISSQSIAQGNGDPIPGGLRLPNGISDEDVRAKCNSFMDSLSVPNVQDDFDGIDDPSPNTCAWIYDHPMYCSWVKSSESCTLHLAGKMGSGKSVLTKHVLKNIKREFPSPPTHDDEIVVLYYFCTRVNRPGESAASLLGSLVYQLLARRQLLFRSILQQTEIMDSSPLSGNSGSWSLPTLWKILFTLLDASLHSTVHLFIDALDECDLESTQKFLSLYHKSHTSDLFRKKKIKFFISSQQRPHILDGFHQLSNVHHLAITSADVAKDIEVVLSLNLDLIKEQFGLESDETLELQYLLASKADGMFQWASIALNELRNADDCTLDSLFDLVNNLPPKLGDLYGRALKRSMDLLPKKDHDLLKRILIWLLLASRPLTIAELTLALAIGPDDTTVPTRRRRHLGISRFISKHLTPFVEIICTHSNPNVPRLDPLSCLKDPRAIVRPVHQSAQQFLFHQCLSAEESGPTTLKMDATEGHEYITRTCLVYLRSKELQFDWLGPKIPNKYGLLVNSPYSTEELNTRIKENELFAYSAQTWAYHLQHCEHGQRTKVFDLAIDFLEHHQNTSGACLQICQFIAYPERTWYWPPGLPLAEAVRSRSYVIAKRLLARKATDIDARLSTGTTALMEVCSTAPPPESPMQSEMIFELLLENGADPLLLDNFGRTALHWAADSGMLRSLQLLLKQNIDINLPDMEGSTPLFLTNFSHRLEATRLLLSYGADFDMRTRAGATPLHWAVATGQITAVRELISAGANIDTRDTEGDTPLFAALSRGYVDIAMLLIENNTEIALATTEENSPIHWAAWMGHVEILKKILDLGVAVDSVNDGRLRTPLHLAALHGQFRCCEMLLQRGAAIDSLEHLRKTPLMLAVFGRHISTVQCLLENGAGLDCQDHHGASPAHIAAKKEKRDILHAIHSAGGNLSILNKIGWTPLHYAARGGMSDAVQFLLVQGVDVNTADKKGRSPLHLAAAHCSAEIASSLLDYGAKFFRDHNGWTPLDIGRQHGLSTEFLKVFMPDTPIAEEKKSPTCWNLDDKGAALEISVDGLTVTLPETTCDQINPAIGKYAEQSVRADFCMPDTSGEYYFEVDILENNVLGCVAVGFSDYSNQTRHLETLPGWEDYSWGYHGDDGRIFNLFSCVGGSDEYADTFSTGDTIGCGVDFRQHTAYFTKNGRYLDIAFTEVRGQLYPMVGLDYPGSKITARFGLPPPAKVIDDSVTSTTHMQPIITEMFDY